MMKGVTMSKHDKQDVIAATTQEDNNQTIGNSADSELTQLRNILFGTAKTELQTQIDQLRQEMQLNFELSAKKLQQEMSDMQHAIQHHVNQLDQRIAVVDNQQDDKTTKLNDYADKIASELEMNASISEEQDGQIQKRLDNEIELLTSRFTKQHDQTIELLNQVKNDLNTTKTDRKTLARLLATVASGLEVDDDC
jgi:hypothetical protein